MGTGGAALAQRRFALPHRPNSAARTHCQVRGIVIVIAHTGVKGSGVKVMWQSEAPLNLGP